MKRSLGNFTRGIQMFETFAMMFASGLKPLFWAAAALIGVAVALCLWRIMQPGDTYYCLMRAWMAAWHWIGLNTEKLVNIRSLSGGTIAMRPGDVASYGPVADAWGRLMRALTLGLKIGSGIAVPVGLSFALYARQMGTKAVERVEERGEQITTLPDLLARIADYNDVHGAADRAADFRRIYGRTWRLQQPFVRRRERLAAGMYEPYTIAGVPYPWKFEPTHMMALGTTGTGKSTVLKELVVQIRARGKRAVIFDLTGAFVEAFYNPETDILLNPLDTRCPLWSVFHDCATKAEFTAAAEALIPNDGGGGDPFWVQAARLLFVEACLKLKIDGKTDNDALYDELMTSSLKSLHNLVQGSVAGPLTDIEAKRMAESIRAVLNTNMSAIDALPRTGTPFSIKQWVINENSPGILFIVARYVDLPTVKVLLTLWMDLAINTLMSLPAVKRDVRMWFLFDELGALHRLPALERALTTGRGFGGAVVMGVHTISKLRDTYGDKIADTLASLARTKLILATPDHNSAKWCSEQIGSGEWRQMEQGMSYGVNNVRDAMTLTPKRQLEPLVLPDDIARLPSLSGWLKLPEGMPAAPITLTYTAYPKVASAFIARDIPIKRMPLTFDINGAQGGPSQTVEEGEGRMAADLAEAQRAAEYWRAMAGASMQEMIKQTAPKGRRPPPNPASAATAAEAEQPVLDLQPQPKPDEANAAAERATAIAADPLPDRRSAMTPATRTSGVLPSPPIDLTRSEMQQDFGDGQTPGHAHPPALPAPSPPSIGDDMDMGR